MVNRIKKFLFYKCYGQFTIKKENTYSLDIKPITLKIKQKVIDKYGVIPEFWKKNLVQLSDIYANTNEFRLKFNKDLDELYALKRNRFISNKKLRKNFKECNRIKEGILIQKYYRNSFYKREPFLLKKVRVSENKFIFKSLNKKTRILRQFMARPKLKAIEINHLMEYIPSYKNKFLEPLFYNLSVFLYNRGFSEEEINRFIFFLSKKTYY
jgi:hypothetical protein